MNALVVGAVSTLLSGLMLAAGTQAPDPLLEAVLREAGTTGVVVLLLWYRLDRLEDRVRDNEAALREAPSSTS